MFSEHFRAYLFTLLIRIGLLLTVCIADAQWEEIPSQGTTLDLGGTANAKATAFTGQAIRAEKQYWAGAQFSQITADGAVLTQNLNTRLQGGYDFLRVSLQGFVAAKRDMHSEFTTSLGGYFRKIQKVGQLDLVIGIGNFVEREQVRAELGLNTTDPTVLSYWLWSIGTKYDLRDTVGLHAQVIATPEARFKHWRGTATLGTDILLDTHLTLKLQSTTDFRTDSTDGTAVDTENSVLLSINF